MEGIKYWLVLTVFILLTIGLTPIANLFLNYQVLKPIVVDRQFDMVSARLQISCSNCHTPGYGVMPWYANFPIINDIIRNDVNNAQKAFILSPQNLTGELPFTPLQLNKMQAVLRQGYMPPPRYLVMHWKAIIPWTETKDLLNWIEKHDPNFN